MFSGIYLCVFTVLCVSSTLYLLLQGLAAATENRFQNHILSKQHRKQHARVNT